MIRSYIARKEKDTKKLYRFLPQSRSSHVPLVLPRRVHYNLNLITNAQAHKKEISYAQAQSKRLLNKQITKNKFSFNT